MCNHNHEWGCSALRSEVPNGYSTRGFCRTFPSLGPRVSKAISWHKGYSLNAESGFSGC
jgi:hypothetical protein